MQPIRLAFPVLAFALATGCTTSGPTASSPRGGPRGLRASEHLEVARQDDERAREDNAFPEPHPIVPGTIGDPGGGVPWVRRWDTHADHERLARIHRSEAAAIQAEFDEACRGRAVADIARSPLQHYGIGGTTTPTGVVIYLSVDAGPPDALIAAMRCHRAWMLLAPPANMEDCPLDLPDIAVDARGDKEGITLTIAEPHANLVGELQRRAAHELEGGPHR